MDIEPIKDKGKTQPYLESCLALAFEIESVFAKPVADPTIMHMGPAQIIGGPLSLLSPLGLQVLL